MPKIFNLKPKTRSTSIYNKQPASKEKMHRDGEYDFLQPKYGLLANWKATSYLKKEEKETTTKIPNFRALMNAMVTNSSTYKDELMLSSLRNWCSSVDSQTRFTKRLTLLGIGISLRQATTALASTTRRRMIIRSDNLDLEFTPVTRTRFTFFCLFIIENHP